MAYVELLFARKMFLWFSSIVVIIGILIVSSVLSFPANVHVSKTVEMPYGAVFSIAGYAACIMTTMIAATLNRDRGHLPYMWTRPVRREQIAFGYMLVDVITIVLAFFVVAATATFVLRTLPMFRLGPDPDAGVGLLRYLVLPLMWYAVVEAVTSWNSLKGPAIAGIAWAVFWILLGISAVRLPAPFAWIVAVLNIFNPLAYFVTRHGSSVLVDPVTLSKWGSQGIIPFSYSAQTALAYAIFFTGCIIATFAWRRMEA